MRQTIHASAARTVLEAITVLQRRKGNNAQLLPEHLHDGATILP
jgi:hypothetical protein